MIPATHLESLAVELCRHPAMAKLDALLREETGLGLMILLPKENEKLEVVTAGDLIRLPDFCKLMRASEVGSQRCITCRSLTSFAAINRGLVQHSCHGGVSLLAAPVVFSDGAAPELFVICSCAFSSGSTDGGWRAARRHVKGADIDMKKLRKSYYALPCLKGHKLALAQRLLDVAAVVLAGLLAARTSPPAIAKPRAPRLEKAFSDALNVSLGRQFEGLGRSTGAALVQVVAGVVRRNPEMPYSVTEIARAAHMSPNHFSALFHQHMGQSFSTFVAWMRISLAQELLRDLTLSIQEVAERAGFDNANYFARRFRQKTGLSPRRWRSAL
ncbi:MAG TPA: helix-turn-helix domain-containing protein [Kiritimatiellia bacterium]|nr:helix-turn-helix domain-containing protein [Kiritimatiellia bacterium]